VVVGSEQVLPPEEVTAGVVKPATVVVHVEEYVQFVPYVYVQSMCIVTVGDTLQEADVSAYESMVTAHVPVKSLPVIPEVLVPVVVPVVVAVPVLVAVAVLVAVPVLVAVAVLVAVPVLVAVAVLVAVPVLVAVTVLVTVPVLVAVAVP